MGIRSTIALRLSRTAYVRRALEEEADLAAFRERPSKSLIIGVGLIALAFVVGWGGPLGFGVAGAVKGDAWLFLAGGGAAYLVSWGIFGLGMLIAGKENARFANVLARWGARRWVEKHLPPGSSQSSVRMSLKDNP